MIQVTIFKRFDLYQGFKVCGHAGYDDSGKDIICAAVSVLVINCINSIEKFTEDDFTVDEDQKTGMIHFQLTGSTSHETNLLMDSLILGLESILEDNKQYIKLEFKEV